MPSTWAFEDKTLRIIHLTQDMGYTLTVTASTFFPDSSDTTSYSWKDSSNNTRKMEMPPYFIYDLNEAVANMQEYATLSRSSYISSLLDGHNQVACLTFEAAFRYLDTNESSLISHALSLWAATRLTERTWRVCGPYTLDFNPSTERDNPWNGIIPVTPIMDTQLDEAAIKGLLIPLKTKVLMELDRKMKQPDPKTWYEVSLALCIVLNNFEWIFADVVDYTTRHGMKSASRGGVSLSEGYVHACKSLLSVFHFAFPDSVPFSTIKTRPIKVDDYVTAEQAEYLHSIRDALLKQGDKMADWRTRSMYETPLYWVYQLFLDDWKGDIKHITPVDNFTEEDFMTT
ncbi:hypothetical protein F5Y19DRAFT_227142 [Xylariaceae sp. FL1651]|nr:hypothetical protein F5Y19DRAFT_227142 [Xylariaceae sp. FL1651]